MFLLACQASASDSQAAQMTTAPSSAPALTFSEKAERLDRLFRGSSQAQGHYILHYQAGEQSFARAYGYLDCARTRPMRADALFDGGSLTKSFTAAAIYKLIEEGRLKLDDRLGELFADVPSAKRNITVSQLLQHRSGIPNLIDGAGKPMAQSAWSAETYDYAPLRKAEMLRLAWIAPLEFAPGTAEAYSNYGFNLLAAIIEQASGLAYETYVRQRIFAPLSMARTGYSQLRSGDRPIAEQCRGGVRWGDPITKGLWRRGVSWRLMGTGGMMTTADDLQRFNAALASPTLFRPDVDQRFRANYFGPSYKCGTEAAFVGGSNRMTRSLIIHLPARSEAVVAVSTERDHPHPAESEVRAAICGR
jgi:CubicO group peptidase (beta-lactamase class C family)